MGPTCRYRSLHFLYVHFTLFPEPVLIKPKINNNFFCIVEDGTFFLSSLLTISVLSFWHTGLWIFEGVLFVGFSLFSQTLLFSFPCSFSCTVVNFLCSFYFLSVDFPWGFCLEASLLTPNIPWVIMFSPIISITSSKNSWFINHEESSAHISPKVRCL